MQRQSSVTLLCSAGHPQTGALLGGHLVKALSAPLEQGAVRNEALHGLGVMLSTRGRAGNLCQEGMGPVRQEGMGPVRAGDHVRALL